LTGFGSHRASPGGTIALSGFRRGATGCYVFRGGALTKLSELYTPSDLTSDGRQLGNFVTWNDDSATAVNSSDQIATWCRGANSSGPSVCLIDPASKTVRLVYNTRSQMSDGSLMTDIWFVAVDDSGRVLFYGPTANGTMLAFWDGKVARKVVASAKPPSRGHGFQGCTTPFSPPAELSIWRLVQQRHQPCDFQVRRREADEGDRRR